MKRIYLASNIAQAQLVVNFLQQQLIPAFVENAHQSSGLGELAVSYPEVWIKRAQDEACAKSLIQRFEENDTEKLPDKICQQCAETNPASFDICWSCAQALN